MSATWTVPRELVERLVGPVGLSHIITARLRGAAFKPDATLVIRHERFMAVLDFVEPVGAEKQDGIAVMLAVSPERERNHA